MTGSRNKSELKPVKLADDPMDERTPVQKYLAEIGRKGGLKGGQARAKSLSPERRKEIAAKASASRWKKKANR